MDHYSKKHFYMRSRFDTLHGVTLRNQSSRLSGDLGALTDSVFVHLPAVFGTEEPPAFDENQPSYSSAIPSHEWIAWNFYKKHYCDIAIKRGSGGKSINPETFIDEVIYFTNSGRRNSLFFLQGDIGCGKTAFINYIITKHGFDLFDRKSIWFVRVNVDVLDHRDDHNLESVFFLFCRKLRLVLQKIFDGGFLKYEHDSEHFITSLATIYEVLDNTLQKKGSHNIQDFYRAVKLTNEIFGRRLLLIIDNLDGFLHENDRYTFLSDIDTAEAPFLQFIRRLVNEFYHSSTVTGDLGANVLFVVRPDSYERIKATRVLFQGVEDPFSDNKNLYSLSVADWDEVVHERVSLIKTVLDKVSIEGKRKSLNDNMKPVLTALSNSQTREELVQRLQQISTFGLRSVMRFLRQYTWLNPNHDEGEIRPISRYLKQVPVGLLCFMLDGRQMYSQKESHFPNMFFSNVEPDEEELANAEISDYTSQAWPLSASHPHSYWIKTLLLSFLEARNRRQEAVRTRDIVDVFARDERGFYSSSLVRLCLGSFAQAHISNLIDVKRQLSADERRLVVSDIRLTQRAKYCIDDVFPRFFYLQLVVDDYSLPLPRKCAEFFTYKNDLDYSYLVKDGSEYHQGSKAMIQEKSKRVVKFLAILHNSLLCEKEKYSAVFEGVSAEGVQLPDTRRMKGDLFREFDALKSSRNSPAASLDISNLQEMYDMHVEETMPFLRKAYAL